MPKVSVIMPVFNGSEYLEEAIESVINQSFKNFEFIIIDDNSTEDIYSVLNKYKKDKRLRVFKNDHNLGVAKSLNKALKLAEGEYIARFDGDDVCLKNRLSKQVEFLDKHKDYGLIGSNSYIINSNGEIVNKTQLPLTDDEIRREILKRNIIIHPSVMFRKQLVEKVGSYSEVFNGAEDYDLWFRFLNVGKISNLPDCLLKRRIHGQAVTQRTHIKSEILAVLIRIKNITLILKIIFL